MLLARFGDGITIIGALTAFFGAMGLRHQATLAVTPAPAVVSGDATDFSWPDDPDAVPNWRLAQERRAADIGATLPSYRTRRAYEAMLDSWVDRACPPVSQPVSVACEPLPALSTPAAASAFLSHMLEAGGGEFSNEALTESYLAFCHAANRAPSPENFVRQALRRMAGVSTRMVDGRGRDNKRMRYTLWTIAKDDNDAVALRRVA